MRFTAILVLYYATEAPQVISGSLYSLTEDSQKFVHMNCHRASHMYHEWFEAYKFADFNVLIKYMVITLYILIYILQKPEYQIAN